MSLLTELASDHARVLRACNKAEAAQLLTDIAEEIERLESAANEARTAAMNAIGECEKLRKQVTVVSPICECGNITKAATVAQDYSMTDFMTGSGSVLVTWLCPQDYQYTSDADDKLFPWGKASVRLQKLFASIHLRTFGDVLRYGRDSMMEIKGMGCVSMHEMDDIMEQHGFYELWLGSRNG